MPDEEWNAMASLEAIQRSMETRINKRHDEIKESSWKRVIASADITGRLTTAAAQKEMVPASLLAIAAPILVGIFVGVEAVVGLLTGATVTGFVLAVMMANAGGAWDNAKKFIEEGHHGGKGSIAHKAGVVGDTVGDPFKDTSGPSLNILIKLMSMVSIVFASFIIANSFFK